MNIESAFPSKFLKAVDLNEGPLDMTIRSVEYEPVGRERLMKPVVYFKDEEKGFILNKTNAKEIVKITGSKDTHSWIDQVISLFATSVEFGGDTVEAIRVRPVKRQGVGAESLAP